MLNNENFKDLKMIPCSAAHIRPNKEVGPNKEVAGIQGESGRGNMVQFSLSSVDKLPMV